MEGIDMGLDIYQHVGLAASHKTYIDWIEEWLTDFWTTVNNLIGFALAKTTLIRAMRLQNWFAMPKATPGGGTRHTRPYVTPA